MCPLIYHVITVSFFWLPSGCLRANHPLNVAGVPDEQKLYQDLMYNYESSVRPVMNASTVMNVRFKLALNQIVDLEERTQVLTTNVFIDQDWTDENLQWDPEDYNGIKTLRVPAAYVWLPDTFIFNNADDGSTGFMQGVYVLLNFNGTVLWPVPVKLKSSCKVDIAYFPFDDQECILRFGSWIYSGEWMNFDSSIDSVDLRNYIDNSEWDLVGLTFEKSMRKYTEEMHPDLTYTLHIRRRTFYYIFNIIVPCIMLSVLTLLTFWLPTTSGEKISLGLSVFLAFSMFMLLIAEEVPATSESVPLIGIYLTTVMTLTSVSVVMAVMVINLYNRGSRANRAPNFLKKLVLCWMCKLLRMSNDLEMLAKAIKLDETEESRYNCAVHRPKPSRSRRGSRSITPRASLENSPCNGQSPEFTPYAPRRTESTINCDSLNDGQARVTSLAPPTENYCYGRPMVTTHIGNNNHTSLDYAEESESQCDTVDPTVPLNIGYASDNAANGFNIHRRSIKTYNKAQCDADKDRDMILNHNDILHYGGIDKQAASQKLAYSTQSSSSMPVTNIGTYTEEEEEEDEDTVWLRRESVLQRERQALVKPQPVPEQTDTDTKSQQSTSKRFKSFRRKSKKKENKAKKKMHISEDLRKHAMNEPGLEFFLTCGRHDILAGLVASACRKEKALAERRAVIVEWQTIATVIDRLLFWIFLIGTLAAYIIILFAMPATKPLLPTDVQPFHVLKNAPHD